MWDVGVGEVWLDGPLDVRSVDDVGMLFGELEVLETFEVVERCVLEVVLKAEEGVEAACEFILVPPKPWTPMIVCATPSGTEKVPCPLVQSQVPASTEDWQHQLPPPQDCKDPLLDEPVSSVQTPIN